MYSKDNLGKLHKMMELSPKASEDVPCLGQGCAGRGRCRASIHVTDAADCTHPTAVFNRLRPFAEHSALVFAPNVSSTS